MRHAAFAFVCSMFLLAYYWRSLHAASSIDGFSAFVLIAVGFAAAWVAWFALERPGIQAIEKNTERQGRREKGLCEQCGYDLTGNVSGVCPECGKSAAGIASDEA